MFYKHMEILGHEVDIYDYKEGIEILKEYTDNAEIGIIKRKKTTVKIVDLICTFDIETTKVKNNNSEKQDGKYSHFNYCFCWQFIVMDLFTGEYKFIFGRYINEFFIMMTEWKKYLTENEKGARVYVHNLAYEYNNLAEYFFDLCGNDIFMRDSVHPLIVGDDTLDFRCSYQLTHKSLAQLSKEIGLVKGGDFDYNKQRHSETILSDYEYEYCFRDVYNLAVWLKQEVVNYGYSYISDGRNKHQLDDKPHVAFMPLTQTGYVRSDVRFKFSQTKGKMRPYLYKLDNEEYRYVKQAFRGGDTHANFRRAGEICKNIFHRDFTSAYPSVMLLEKFPAYDLQNEPLSPIDNEFNKKILYKKINNGRACIFTVMFKNIRCKSERTPYITKSMQIFGFTYNGQIINEKALKNSECDYPLVYDNGRVLQTPLCRVTICEQDLMIINDCYDYDDVLVLYLAHSSKDYLPNEIRAVICKYFYNKTCFKGVIGKEYDYLLSKQKLNGIYGLSATSLEHDIWYLDEELNVISQESEFKNGKVMPYLWAVWVTAYVRRNLNYFKSALGNSFIYCDTDSIFYEYKEGFEELVEKYNEDIKKRLEELAVELGDRDMVIPKNPKGQEQYLGTFSADEDYEIEKFITIGAKRYVTLQARKYKGQINHDMLNVTFAGLTDTKGHTGANGEWRKGANIEYIEKKYKHIGDIFDIFRKIAISPNLSILVPYRNENVWYYDDNGKEVYGKRNIGKLCNYVERGEFEGDINDGQTVQKVSAKSSMVLVETDTTITRDGTLGELIDNYLIINTYE